MSSDTGGLVVRPGDTLVIPLVRTDRPTSREEVDYIRARLEEVLAGVTVQPVWNMGGNAFVYRPTQVCPCPDCGGGHE